MADKPNAEELIAEELGITLDTLKIWLRPFCHNPMTTELLLLLGAGIMLGTYNVKEVCDRLGLSPHPAYAALQFQSVHRWRKLLGELGYEMAIPLLSSRNSRRKAQRPAVGPAVCWPWMIVCWNGCRAKWAWSGPGIVVGASGWSRARTSSVWC